MSIKSYTSEDDVEQQALDLLETLGYATYRSHDYKNPNPTINDERNGDDRTPILRRRLYSALQKFNPGYDTDVYDEAVKQFEQLADSPDMMTNNHFLHRLIIGGAKIKRSIVGETRTLTLRVIDFEDVGQNDFVATSQFTMKQGEHERRPDVSLFVNGLPLVTFEFKDLDNENVGISDAWNQFQTYKAEIDNYMQYNEILVISDGISARAGSLTAGEDRFMQWRLPDEVSGVTMAGLQLDSLIRGMMEPKTLLDIIKNFIIFEQDGDKTFKILAAYHQYYMVNKAIAATRRTIENPDDNRIGVVWHTQGSGKSLSMVFYSGIVARELNNPTIVVINDRNDLDDQLAGTFGAASDFLGQVPSQAKEELGLTGREDMRRLLSVNAGGIVFTTIQKFAPDTLNGEQEMPVLTNRSNVIVMADEAHRSQYGLTSKYTGENGTRYGYAKYLRDALPNASFIGFTGTPIDQSDKSTQAVFGDYIDVYDMTQAVADHATVKIYYESHVIPLTMEEHAQKQYDDLLHEAGLAYDTDGDVDPNAKRKQELTRLESIAGATPRVKKLVRHFVDHFELRQQQEFGKAMIVAMSRRNAVKIYDEIIALRPGWHSDDIDSGKIKIIMTAAASDDAELVAHHTSKKDRAKLQRRMKDNDDELQIVIVVDMWLTGFDAPATNTMYIDKPMHGHNLMQAIARVNRVFRDKENGLVVDYLGIADDLKQALKQYSPSDQKQTGISIEKALAVMLEKYQIITRDYLYGIDYADFNSSDRSMRMHTLRTVLNELTALNDEEQKGYLDTVTQLQRAFALVATQPDAQDIADEMSFFVALKNAIIKLKATTGAMSEREIDYRMRQLLDKSIIPGDVVDLYEELGLDRPELNLLSDAFLAEVEQLPEKNTALSLLERLLKGQVKSLSRSNLIKARKFQEALEAAIELYNARGLTTEIAIRNLIEMAKEINEAKQEGQELGLSPEEVAFYDALADHDRAVEEMGEEKLHQLASELVKSVRKNAGTDWTRRSNVKALMRREVKKLLREFGYPPDFAVEAVDTVVEQAEKMALNES
ncbi:type I restriction endonuclease subunit R [Periweissella cryptocerci]|uniref:Type I restriction enzyme endonuclease subunit n=1 Tax=Periweissella cryptocerci TaxID=2506420 RepID=A0A4P6YSS3_9LACO|nr:type I restriction endonuclease subunit R [Periweissella cryptocerci]QBO35778.1 type I restriction endonuclease subunit R [Periweissella cryptocerci]